MSQVPRDPVAAAALLAAVAAPARVLVVGSGAGPAALAAALAERVEAVDRVDPDQPAPRPDYDLAVCLGVLPTLEPAAGSALLDRLAALAPLLAVSAGPVPCEPGDPAAPPDPTAAAEPLGRTAGGWAALLADRGYHRRFDADLTEVDPWAVLLARRAAAPRELVAAYEDALVRVCAEAAERRSAVRALQRRLAARVDAEVAAAQQQARAAERRALQDRDALVGAQASAGRLAWELDRVHEELAALRKDNEAILAGARALEDDVRDRLARAADLAERHADLERRYEQVRTSSRYRLGRLLLAPGAAVRRNWESDL